MEGPDDPSVLVSAILAAIQSTLTEHSGAVGPALVALLVLLSPHIRPEVAKLLRKLADFLDPEK